MKPIFAAILVGAQPGAAFAHAMLEKAAPPVGGTVSSAPTVLVLDFSEDIEPGMSRVKLAAKNGDAVALGALSTTPKNRRQLIAPIEHPLAPGLYHVEWRVISIDLHITEGDYDFTVKK
ncbi:MAG TPA: copper homeostasis periplasmic binding protein CopC [Parvularculaceae bacterium]|nr:copper homeostasis periplasmic binding protein CopC [Parvularculaceae bacterium]